MIETINALILKTARAYPFDLCRQPKSFSFLTRKEDIASSNFGMTYSGFKKGYYWGRSFEGNGANADLLTAEKPAVYLKQSGVVESLHKGKECLTFELGIIDIVDCDTCGEDCRRTEGEIKRDLINTLIAIRDEILKNVSYFVTYSSGATATIWATPAEMDANTSIATKEEVFNISKIDKLIKFGSRIDITETGVANQLAAFIQLTYCDCKKENIVFDYTEVSFDQSAAAKCETCP